MTVLVTGGAGYIGSHTARLLRERGREIVVLDSLEGGHREAALGAPLVVGDIADADLVRRTVTEHGVDSIVHFAAYKAAGESMTHPGKYFGNNVAKTSALVDTARTVGVDRIVFSSSCSVYGTPRELPVTEDHPFAPESPYAESKRIVEDMLRWYGVAHGTRSVSLRYFNAAGASVDAAIGEDWTDPLNLIPVVMRAAYGLIPHVTVHGTDYPTRDGTAVRDYVHVDDLADAHVRALEYLEAGGDSTAINLGTGVGSTVKEVLETARQVTEREIPSVDGPRRPGDPSEVYGDLRRARAVLGWTPRHDLRAILRTAWEWHSRHPDGYATPS